MAQLDLSATFNTVDHAIFLDRLSKDFGMGGHPLDLWNYIYQTDPVGHSEQRSIEKVSLGTGFPQLYGGGGVAHGHTRGTLSQSPA